MFRKIGCEMKRDRCIVLLFTAVLLFVGCTGTPNAVPSGTESGLPPAEDPVAALDTVSFTRVCNGFLLTEDNYAVYVGTGSPVSVPMDRVQTTISHNGTEIAIDFGWARYDNKLAVTASSGSYSVEPLKGSQTYLVFSLEFGYCYLYNVDTGTVADPLASLDNAIVEHLSSVSFSPNAQSAVVQYNSGMDCVLLDCATGQTTELPYDPGVYAVSGFFLDNTNVILCSAFEDDVGIQFCLTRYDLISKEISDIPGRYTAKEKNADNFLAICDDAFAYSSEGDYLTLIDLATWEKVKTAFQYDTVDRVFFCPDSLAGVVCDEVVYIVDCDGNEHAVCKIE